MKKRTLILLLAVHTLIGPATSEADRLDQSLDPSFSAEQLAIIQRKGRKYGLNPNLITAALAVEEAQGESVAFRETRILEWAAENCGRRLTVCTDRERSAYRVLRLYAELGQDNQNPATSVNAKRFAKRATRIFNAMEKETPWKTDQTDKSGR
ncbi:MAG: hypothetical protein O3A47_11130 [Chloroflexi bacterium]|nr:hypothetical protein [Chloroflexota bacterium]